MWFYKRKQHELKMTWKVTWNERSSFLVGTAHFFPYSFRSPLINLLKSVEKVFLEGPLDEWNMNKAAESGVCGDGCRHVLQALEPKTLMKLTDLFLPGGTKNLPFVGVSHRVSPEDAVMAMFERMKPWLFFFTVYKGFLDKKGWKYSVDMEAYQIAQSLGKEVHFLETMDEQIEVLENLSLDNIVNFVNRISEWEHYTKDFTQCYLDGNLDQVTSNPYKFPTRSPDVIQRRDAILLDRMLPHLEQGSVAVFVGVPHVHGIRRMLTQKGLFVEQVAF